MSNEMSVTSGSKFIVDTTGAATKHVVISKALAAFRVSDIHGNDGSQEHLEAHTNDIVEALTKKQKAGYVVDRIYFDNPVQYKYTTRGDPYYGLSGAGRIPAVGVRHTDDLYYTSIIVPTTEGKKSYFVIFPVRYASSPGKRYTHALKDRFRTIAAKLNSLSSMAKRVWGTPRASTALFLSDLYVRFGNAAYRSLCTYATTVVKEASQTFVGGLMRNTSGVVATAAWLESAAAGEPATVPAHILELLAAFKKARDPRIGARLDSDQTKFITFIQFTKDGNTFAVTPDERGVVMSASAPVPLGAVQRAQAVLMNAGNLVPKAEYVPLSVDGTPGTYRGDGFYQQLHVLPGVGVACNPDGVFSVVMVPVSDSEMAEVVV